MPFLQNGGTLFEFLESDPRLELAVFFMIMKRPYEELPTQLESAGEQERNFFRGLRMDHLNENQGPTTIISMTTRGF